MPLLALLLCALALVHGATITVPCPSQSCPYADIVTAAGQAQDGDTILLSSGTFRGGCGGAVFAANNLVIEGNVTVISCFSTGPAFIINGNNPTVSNIIFNDTESGAVVMYGAGGTLKNVAVQGFHGSAVAGTDLTLLDTSFFWGSTENNGGAVNAHGSLVYSGGICAYLYAYQGGCVNVNGSAVIEGVGFGTNSAASNGGAVYVSGDVLLNDTSVNLGEAGLQGSAVYTLGALTIVGGEVRTNSLRSLATAVFSMVSIEASNTIFQDNSGQQGGAALAPEMTLTGCTFRDNFAQTRGGAVYALNNLTVTNCTFDHNQALYGGAIMGGGTVLLNSGLFVANSANNNPNGFGGDGGAIFMQIGGTTWGLVIAGEVTFIGNSAYNSGGAIQLSEANPPITHGTFLSNTASNAGAIMAMNGVLLLGAPGHEIVFIENVATDSGGAVYVATGGFNISDTWFQANQATREGGGLYMTCLAGGCVGRISASRFESSSAVAGGGIYVIGNEVSLESTTFNGNFASVAGAAISLQTGSVSLSATNPCSFFNNTAAEYPSFSCTGGTLLLPGVNTSDPGPQNGLPRVGSSVDCARCGCCMPLLGTVMEDCFLYPGQLCNVSCEHGYDHVGAQATMCIAPPTTYVNQDICEAVECAPLNATQIPAHAVVAGGTCADGAVFGDDCIFACAPGYKVDGIPVAGTCSASGFFAGMSINCVVDTTAPPPPPSSGLSPQGAAILGGVLGGVVLLGISGFAYWRCFGAGSKAARGAGEKQSLIGMK